MKSTPPRAPGRPPIQRRPPYEQSDWLKERIAENHPDAEYFAAIERQSYDERAYVWRNWELVQEEQAAERQANKANGLDKHGQPMQLDGQNRKISRAKLIIDRQARENSSQER